MTRNFTKYAVALAIVMVGAIPMSAVEGSTNATATLEDFSLEQLINVRVTSVAKKETPLSQSPAAITVITDDEIRRLGITSLPEALRLVPGMDVARIDGNEWAISSRGFNHEFANKLLVLIDGRTVYTPASGGVFWDSQDVVLEDLDRIEVIRGPGATLWGANAVNGVINIISKGAKDTQGAMISTTVGTEDQPSTAVRYGGQLGSNVFYRVYAKYYNRDGLVVPTGSDAQDDWWAARGGFRLDWEPSLESTFTLQGDYYNGQADKPIEVVSLTPPYMSAKTSTENNAGGNVLARWTRTFSDDNKLTAQAYYDHVQQGDGMGTEYRDTIDFDLQHQFSLGDRNDFMWGAGYRYANVENTPSFNLTWTPETTRLKLFESFIQDDIALVPDQLHLTLGSKFENNNLTGWQIEPSARLLWNPAENQTVWAAVSRANRTPALFERKSRLNEAAFQPPAGPPVLITEFGNAGLEDEKLTAYELGYRIEPTKTLSFDLSGFFNQYSDLIVAVAQSNQFEVDPAPPHVLVSSKLQNADRGETYGTELSAQWKATPNWTLKGSYTWLHMHLHPDASAEEDSPQQQFQLQSYLDLPHHLELNGAGYFVDQIHPQAAANRVPVSAYFRLDLGVVWHPSHSLELGVWGQNLLQEKHTEFTSLTSPTITQVPRSVLARITWKF